MGETLLAWFLGVLAVYKDGCPCDCDCCKYEQAVHTDAKGAKDERAWAYNSEGFVHDCRYLINGEWKSGSDLGIKAGEPIPEHDERWCVGEFNYPLLLPRVYRNMQKRKSRCATTVIDTPGFGVQWPILSGGTSTLDGTLNFRVRVLDTCKNDTLRAELNFRLRVEATVGPYGEVIDGPTYDDGGETTESSRYRGPDAAELHASEWDELDEEGHANTLHWWVYNKAKNYDGDRQWNGR